MTAHVDLSSAGSSQLKIHFDGKVLALGKIELLDLSGKNVITGEEGFIISPGDEKSFDYGLFTPLSASMKLKLTVFVGQKDYLVPFDLHDIPLP